MHECELCSGQPSVTEQFLLNVGPAIMVLLSIKVVMAFH